MDVCICAVLIFNKTGSGFSGYGRPDSAMVGFIANRMRVHTGIIIYVVKGYLTTKFQCYLEVLFGLSARGVNWSDPVFKSLKRRTSRRNCLIGQSL